MSAAAFSSPVLGMVLDVLAGSKVDLSDAATVCGLGKITPDEYDALGTTAARNTFMVGVVRAVAASDGYFAGWDCLAHIASKVYLHSSIVEEVFRSTQLFAKLRPSAIQSSGPTDLRAVITRTVQRDSVTTMPPKTLGGKSWMQSKNYAAVWQEWSNGSSIPMIGPCFGWGFPSTQRKLISPRSDIGDCDTMLLLGALVDYDFDRDDKYSFAFAHAMEVAMRHVANIGSRMQGMALLSLINFDVMQHNRVLQKDWMASGWGTHVHGAADLSADDWMTMVVADCACLSAFGYEPVGAYAESRLGMFGAVILGSVYDLLWDRETSNLGAGILYVAAAGMMHHNMHCIFAVSVLDAVARRIFCLGNNAPLYGDSALIGTATWSAFCGRYHAWERFVKYSRQIARSTRSDVQNVLAIAKESLALPSGDFGEAWRQANTPGAEATLIPRITTRYTPSRAPEFAGLLQPELCASCMPRFTEALDAFDTDEIYAVEGVPTSVIKCEAVAIAAAIHRACVFATGVNCCDVCACRIGCWADEASTEVMVALMRSEPHTSASEYLLQCYVAGCVPLAPVSVPAILSGFDLLCEITQHEGAMGCRDVLDW